MMPPLTQGRPKWMWAAVAGAASSTGIPLAGVRLRAPILQPPTVRDFSAFRRDDLAFYFSNPTAIFGPEDEIPYPDGAEELDCEAEVAAVIGADGRIGGFTLMNDWTARDVLRGELADGLGPVKSKDFATSLGPVLLTPDEFDGASGAMIVRINGEERSRDDVSRMRRTWDELVAHAGRNTRLLPGDVIGSGGVFGSATDLVATASALSWPFTSSSCSTE